MTPGHLAIGKKLAVVTKHVVSGAGVRTGFIVVIIDNLEDGRLGR